MKQRHWRPVTVVLSVLVMLAAVLAAVPERAVAQPPPPDAASVLVIHGPATPRANPAGELADWLADNGFAATLVADNAVTAAELEGHDLVLVTDKARPKQLDNDLIAAASVPVAVWSPALAQSLGLEGDASKPTVTYNRVSLVGHPATGGVAGEVDLATRQLQTPSQRSLSAGAEVIATASGIPVAYVIETAGELVDGSPAPARRLVMVDLSPADLATGGQQLAADLLAWALASVPASVSNGNGLEFNVDPGAFDESDRTLDRGDGTLVPVADGRADDGTEFSMTIGEIVVNGSAVAATLAALPGAQVVAEETIGAESLALITFDANAPVDTGALLRVPLADGVEQGIVTLSTPDALRTTAVAASLTDSGVPAGINLIVVRDDIASGTTTEGPSGPNGHSSAVGGWSSDAFTHFHLQEGGPQDTGVTSAWQSMLAVGALESLGVRVGVIDGGFSSTSDLPADTVFVPASADGRPGGSDGGNLLIWHGVGVTEAAVGAVDNGLASAGPGGPVAGAVMIERSPGLFQAVAGTADAVNNGADIVNMSFSVNLPATVSFAAIPFDLALSAAADAGVALITSAGNDGRDVDEEDCFIVCWEATYHFPCENGDVFCIGALAQGSASAAGFSNFGGEVDLFAPGVIPLGMTPFDPPGPGAQTWPGTSFASPFVAGAAALVQTANPGLSARQATQALVDTARPGPGSVSRTIDVQAAVASVLQSRLTLVSFDLPPNVVTGEEFVVDYVVQNTSSEPIDVVNPIVAIRTALDANVDAACDVSGVVAPGDTLACAATVTLTDAGLHTFWPAWQDSTGRWWRLGPDVQRTVEPPVVVPVTVTVEVLELENISAGEGVCFGAACRADFYGTLEVTYDGLTQTVPVPQREDNNNPTYSTVVLSQLTDGITPVGVNLVIFEDDDPDDDDQMDITPVTTSDLGLRLRIDPASGAVFFAYPGTDVSLIGPAGELIFRGNGDSADDEDVRVIVRVTLS